MKHHNNIECLNKFRTRSTRTTGYQEFTYSDQSIFMDTNTLDLYEGDESELPIPASLAPQYPICPNKHLRALVLEVTHACQLRCSYCYVSQYYDEMSSVMDFDTAQEAIDTLIDPRVVERYGFQLGFFGGEALLNFSLIEQVVSYARAKFGAKVSFTLTTNGCLITKRIAEFLAAENFSLVVSIDGPPSLHDENRKDVNGKPTHAKVLKGLKLLKEASVKKVSLRATYLPSNTQLLKRTKYLNQLCDKGYGTNISVEPAFLTETSCVKIPPENMFAITEIEGSLRQEYVDVADYLVDRLSQGKTAYFKNIMVYAQRLLYKQHSPSECGAGVGFMSVNPDGFIFACHREMNSLIGKLSDGGVSEQDRAKWVENRWYQNAKCVKCNYRHACGGPCREHSIGVMKSIKECDPVACEFKKLWIECGARILSKLTPTRRMELIPRKGTCHKPSRKKIFLVREAGGVGDIISMGGAAAQCKIEHPDAVVNICVPNEFVSIGEHLKYVDSVIGVGPLDYLVSHRRARGEKPDYTRDLYLSILEIPENGFVDLWCPATLYEKTQKDRIEYTRSQIFAAEAGCSVLTKAIPEWTSTPEERLKATHMIAEAFPSSSSGPLVGFAPRGTKPASNLTTEFINELLTYLFDMNMNVAYLDCVKPEVLLENNSLEWFNCDFLQSAAIAEQCDIIITVDTSILHLAAALRLPTVGIFSLTDSAPYEDFYPFLEVVQYEKELERCKMPCNRAISKGFGDDCCTGCRRMLELSVDDIKISLQKVMQIAGNPTFQCERMQRMMK